MLLSQYTFSSICPDTKAPLSDRVSFAKVTTAGTYAVVVMPQQAKVTDDMIP